MHNVTLGLDLGDFRLIKSSSHFAAKSTIFGAAKKNDQKRKQQKKALLEN